ncbi:MAG: hypothetical protein QW039_05415 [Fervidicoccaceae archaeon]
MAGGASTYKPALIIFSESQPLSCIDVELVGKLNDVLSESNRIIEKIRQRGTEIVEVKAAISGNEEETRANLLVAVRDVESSALALSREIKASPIVSYSSLSGRFRNICYSMRQFPIDVLGLRWIMMGPGNYEALTLGMKKVLGTQIFPYYQRNLGIHIGKNVYEYYVKALGGIDRLDEAMKFASMLLLVAGWGVIEDWNIAENGITLTIRDNWEIQLFETKMVEEKPRIILGMLEGFFGSLLRRDVLADIVSIKKENKTILAKIFIRF